MVLYLGLNAQGSAAGGGPGIQRCLAFFYFCFVVLLAFSFRKPFALSSRRSGSYYSGFWAVVSTVWSLVPGLTLRRCGALLGTTLVGLFMATRFERETTATVIARASGLTAVASLLVCVFLPGYGI